MAKDLSKAPSVRRREAIRSKNNKHVKALTIKRSQMNPFTGKPFLTNAVKRSEAQFYLRRAWASSLLHNMRSVQNWNWKEIYWFTGRSRQTWKNVTESTYYTDQQLFDDPKKIANYRPVTDGFIARVTYELTDKVKDDGQPCNYVVATLGFVEMYWLGLEVIKKDRAQEAYIFGRLNDNRGTSGWSEHGEIGEFMSKWFFEYNDEFFTCCKTASNKPRILPEYPILETTSLEFNMDKQMMFHQEMESTVFPPPNKETGEPDKRAYLLHNMWLHDMQQRGEIEFEKPMANPNRVKERTKDYTPDQLSEMVELGLMDAQEAVRIADKQFEVRQKMEEIEKREQEEYAADVIDEQIAKNARTQRKKTRHTLMKMEQEKLEKQESRFQQLLLAQQADRNAMAEVFLSVPKSLIPKSGVGEIEYSLKVKVKDGEVIGTSYEIGGLLANPPHNIRTVVE